jgi:hypothetical protein
MRTSLDGDRSIATLGTSWGMADDERIERVQEEIDAARRTAEDADILEDPDEPHFADSGTIAPEQDDQQIAPPG